MRPVRNLTVAGCLLALCAMPATADAATLGAVVINDYAAIELSYEGSLRERNDARLSFDEATRTLVVTDPGAQQITADAGDPMLEWCAFEPRRVTCQIPAGPYGGAPAPYVIATLADRDDRLWTDLRGSLYGGPGADQLTSAASGYANLNGEDGDDRLTGGSGDDRLNGGDGADRMDGGPGRDSVSWWDPDLTLPDLGLALLSPGGVYASLDGVANDGHDRGAEGDNLIGLEVVDGTEYADVIVGGAGDESLSGGDGDDRISGGPGRDAIAGEAGNDRLELQDGEGDRYTCGEGADEVLTDALDVFGAWGASDCETIAMEQ